MRPRTGFSILFLINVLPLTPLGPELGSAVGVFWLVVLCLVVGLERDWKIAIQFKVVGPVLLLISIFSFHIITAPVDLARGSFGAIRYILYSFQIVATLIILPSWGTASDIRDALVATSLLVIAAGIVSIPFGYSLTSFDAVSVGQIIVPVFKSIFENRIHAGSLFAYGSIAALAGGFNSESPFNAYHVASAFCATATFFTQSRTGVGILIIGTAILLAYRLGGRGGIIRLLIGAIPVGVVILLGIVSGFSGLDTSRPVYWKASLLAIAEAPILGYGLEPVSEVIKPYHTRRILGPHNSFLRVWLETGIVSLIAYFYLTVLALIRGVYYSYNTDLAFLTAAGVATAGTWMVQSDTMFGIQILSTSSSLIIGMLLHIELNHTSSVQTRSS